MKAASLETGAALLGSLLLLSGVATPPLAAAPRGGHDARHDVLDARYHHGRFYPTAGVMVHELPVGYRRVFFRGSPYYFHAGVWYEPIAGGFHRNPPTVGRGGLGASPFLFDRVVRGDSDYYANEVCYRWDPVVNGYEVVNAPPGAQEVAPTSSAEDFYIYPQNGQSQDQPSADRFECHTWAKNQTGFDATAANGGVSPAEAPVKRAEYRRAMSACLEGRGYSVK